MIKTRRTKRLVALAVGLSLVAAACGGDDDDDADTPSATDAPEATDAPDEGDDAPEATDAPDEGDDAPEATDAPDEGDDMPDTASAAMIVTVDLHPDGAWEDGSPITAADIECTWLAALNTPGSLSTVGYTDIISVEAGASDKQAVITFSSVYAPYKTLFRNILQASRHADCNDVSLDFEDTPPSSGRPFRIESWSPTQSILVPNENFWGDPPASDQIVFVPFADQDTEKAAIASGEVDLVTPQWDPGFREVVNADDNISLDLRPGAQFEGFYFQSGGEVDDEYVGPFTNRVYREAFAKSIDREAVFQQIYVPIGGEESIVLTCGPIVPGPYCDPATPRFDDIYDPEGAAALLEENGWTKDGSGFWVDPDTGEAPEVRWIINTGNTRRESTQAFLIPKLAELGFNVVTSNCDAACYFQQRLPALDYDMAMYISVPQPDPSYLTSSWTCDQIPTEENGYIGQNSTGACNEEVSALLKQADVTVDEAERTAAVTQALDLLAEDYYIMPLFQFPQSNIWRNDQVGPPEVMAANTLNFTGFTRSLPGMEDLDGDGQVVIGAEQWPECLNPLTECANSSWYAWTVSDAVMPSLWDSTDEQTFVESPLIAGVEVEVL